MGAVSDRSWRDVWIALVPTMAGIALLRAAGPALDALIAGRGGGALAGGGCATCRYWMVAGVGLCVGSGVAVAGIIGFVGLIVLT